MQEQSAQGLHCLIFQPVKDQDTQILIDDLEKSLEILHHLPQFSVIFSGFSRFFHLNQARLLNMTNMGKVKGTQTQQNNPGVQQGFSTNQRNQQPQSPPSSQSQNHRQEQSPSLPL